MARSAIFNVRLLAPLATVATVDYATVDETAIAGVDYEPQSGTLTFQPGQVALQVYSQLLLTAPTPLGAVPMKKTFSLLLSNPSPGLLLGDTFQGRAEILPVERNGHGSPDNPVAEITGTTVDANATAIGSIRNVWGDGIVRLTGSMTARNPLTNDVSVWDVAFAVKVIRGACSIVGLPSISVFAQDPALVSCTLVADANALGVNIVATGLAGVILLWSGTFLITTG